MIDAESLFRQNHSDLRNFSDLTVKYQLTLEELQLTLNLSSLTETDPPNVIPGDSDAEIKGKVEGVKRNTEIIRLGIFENSLQSSRWHRKAVLRLSNYGGESYKSLIRPYFGRWPSVSLGIGSKIALSVLGRRKGDVNIAGFLQGDDSVICSVQYKDGLTLIRRPRMPVSRSRSFGVEVGDKSQQVIPFNRDRKVLLLTNAGSSPVFVSSGEKAETNKGFYMGAGGGTLTLEEGKYSVPLEFHAICAEGESTLITGEEWM